jgi:predicted lysophospholipase L1 biosynthesis ABC-type transport system permease subunit
MPTSMSGHAGIHSAAFFTAFVCLIAACIVLARRFAAQGERGWRTYCITTCILAPLLIIVGMGNQNWIGVIMGSAGIVAFGWVSALAARMYTEVYKTNKIGRLHL